MFSVAVNTYQEFFSWQSSPCLAVAAPHTMKMVRKTIAKNEYSVTFD